MEKEKGNLREDKSYNGGVAFLVRAYEKADFESLWRIDQACFDPKLAYSRFELAVYMRRPGAFTLVAERTAPESETGNGRGEIVGFVVAESRHRMGHIITIDVIAEARRSGVGSALLQAAEENLRRVAANAVELETPVNNATAIRFYKEMGYCVERTVGGYYGRQLDALVMRKELVHAAEKR